MKLVLSLDSPCCLDLNIKPTSQPVSSTLAYNSLFLVPQRNGQVTAYSMIDGKEIWNYTISKGYPLSLHLIKDILFIATTEKELIALNMKDRSILWSKELAGYAFDSITSASGVLYIQAKDIYAIDPNTSKTLWQISSKSPEGFCRGP